MTRWPVAGLCATVALAAGFGCVQAAEHDKPARGQHLVTERCGRCHATGLADKSPHPSVRPLRTILAAGANPMLEAARGTGLVAGHDEMPEFEFSPADIEAIFAYFATLEPAAPAQAPAQSTTRAR